MVCFLNGSKNVKKNNKKQRSDPDSFKPDRWLIEPGVVPRRPDEVMLPVFWGGPRLCLGKDMAALETISVAWSIMQHFKVKRRNKKKMVFLIQ